MELPRFFLFSCLSVSISCIFYHSLSHKTNNTHWALCSLRSRHFPQSIHSCAFFTIQEGCVKVFPKMLIHLLNLKSGLANWRVLFLTPPPPFFWLVFIASPKAPPSMGIYIHGSRPWTFPVCCRYYLQFIISPPLKQSSLVKSLSQPGCEFPSVLRLNDCTCSPVNYVFAWMLGSSLHSGNPQSCQSTLWKINSQVVVVIAKVGTYCLLLRCSPVPPWLVWS